MNAITLFALVHIHYGVAEPASPVLLDSREVCTALSGLLTAETNKGSDDVWLCESRVYYSAPDVDVEANP